MPQLVALLLLIAVSATRLSAADWPFYRSDAARSAYTSERLAPSLTPRWVHRPLHPPEPAWPASDRLRFDHTVQVVVARGRLYFGSSADGKIYCLDAASGKVLWDFFTDAPVRVAPAVWKNRVFVASDDGYLYCLSAPEGRLLWKIRGGPRDDRVLGNDRMVSRWVGRGGPVVLGDTVYFAAGIWPTDGVYIQAVDANSGKVLWNNESAAHLVMDQPHGGARARSGVAAQGHLVAAGDRLLVPTGRAVPASFRLADGSFEYFHLQKYGQLGEASVAVVGPYFFTSGALFDIASGNLVLRLGKGHVARTADGVVFSEGSKVTVARWAEMERKDRKGKPETYLGLDKQHSVELGTTVTTLAVAGNLAICGQNGKVTLLDTVSGRTTGSLTVDGDPGSLAVADGRLFVATDRGTIDSFDTESRPQPMVVEVRVRDSPRDVASPEALAAEEIVRTTGISEGYCLDLACGDGALAFELARRTQLEIYAIDRDADNVRAARRRLEAAGLYGVRVTVHVGDPSETPYPKYFANLVVSGRAVREGAAVVPESEARRVLRPSGGTLCVGRPDAMTKLERGPLAGAGTWTHQYADAGNTSCSTDTLIKGPLSMLWYREADLRMPQRHGRGPAPLFLDGRLVVQGLDTLRGVDAYNGRTLWEYPLGGILKDYDQDHLMGTAGTGSCLCLGGDSVYVRRGARCLRIEAATGKKLAELRAPRGVDGQPSVWGYVAYAGGTLFGSVANAGHVVKWRWREGDMTNLFTESSALFAMDPKNGDLKWTFRPTHSIRHNAIAIGEGRVYLIDRPLADADRLDAGDTKGQNKKQAEKHRTGELVALDAKTGNVLWRNPERIYGTLLAFSSEHGVLLMGYQPTRFRLPSEKGGRLAAFHPSDGYRLWDREAAYASRPLIRGDTIYAEGGAWDLRSGQERTFEFSRSYGCGILASSAHLMVFRSATLGYHDFTRQAGTENYGGIRPGCWINAIPVGGLLLVPDAASGCQCSYLNLASVALQGRE